MASSPGGKRGVEMDREHQKFLDAQPLRVQCVFCLWTFRGPARLARQTIREHRANVHPEVKAPRRPRVLHLKSIRQAALSEDEAREVEAERIRRSYLTGVELNA